MKFDFLKQIFSDVDGTGSSKRATLFIVLALIGIIVIGVTFFHATFNETIWTDLFFALLSFGGMITAEKFTKRGIRNDATNP